MTVKASAPFTRKEITQYLEEHKIGTRLLFGGNLLHQPAFKGGHKVFGELLNSDALGLGCFWIGVHPQINEEKIEYMLKTFRGFMEQYA